jgi:hypothetical protein
LRETSHDAQEIEWGTPSEVAHRRGREGNAAIDAQPLLAGALEEPLGDLDGSGRRRAGDEQRDDEQHGSANVMREHGHLRSM